MCVCVFLPIPSRCCQHGCSPAQVSRGESRVYSGRGVEVKAKTQNDVGITCDAGKLSGFSLCPSQTLPKGAGGTRHPIRWVPLRSTQLGLGESTQEHPWSDRGNLPNTGSPGLSQWNHILQKHCGGVGAWEEGRTFQDLFIQLVLLGILSFTLCLVAALREASS